MAVSVVMPALEMAQETGKLVAWLKKEGEPVRKGEMLLEVETDKAVVEVEAASDGILAGITASPGDVIAVGRTIAWLLAPGEQVPTSGSGSAPTARQSSTPAAPAAGRGLSDPAVRSDSGRAVSAPRISPKARRLAQERGVDISQLTGSGPGGEILADDILAVAAARLKPATTYDKGADDKAPEPLNTIGRLMAERTAQSWTTVPHFFVTREIDASALNTARERLAVQPTQSGPKVTHTDLIVSGVARALRKHPRVNASWTPAGIVLHDEVNIALAIAVDNAVVTAVVPRADAAGVAEIAARRVALAERARSGRLQPDDIAGATFTISNLGMFQVDAFTAIIVPPQAGILAVGAIADRVVAVDGAPVVRPMMTLTLSCDHRVVDGARAAEFMRDVSAELTSRT